VTSIFDGPGTLTDLLTSPRGWRGLVNQGFEVPSDTQAQYGPATPLEGPVHRVEVFDGNFGYAIELQPVRYPDSQRAGVLTLGAVLAARAHPIDPASVQRGVFVLERLLCEEPGQPPAEAMLVVADGLPADATNREQVEAKTGAPGCTSCHDQLNPLGFAFESYDSLGGYRTTDRGQPVDPRGTLQLEGERSFEDATELAAILASSQRVHDCYATQWARYALGDPSISLDDPRFTDVRERFRATSDIRGLLLDLASSDAFRHRGGR
jgi:hypothetical protein